MSTAKENIVVSRRQFLSMVGLTTTATVLPAALDLVGSSADAAKKAKGASKKKAATAVEGPLVAGRAVAGPRVLVVIELQGGNDGFSMLVPTGDARFRQLRNRAWLNPKDLVRFDDRYSIAAGLAPLASRVAFVEGVGVAKPDFSHTGMMTRWWQGDPEGTGTNRTGFLGRCCDLLDTGLPVVGVSVGGGSTPALVSNKAPTVALPGLDSLRELTQDQDARMRPTMGSLTDGGGDTGGLEFADGDLMARARVGLASGLTLLNGLGGITGKTKYPDNRLASALGLARELVSLNVGVRVIHVPWGSFDTHTGHAWSHPEQMRQLGVALTAFHNDLVRSGLSDRVLIATTSEFGRRPEANAGGTDHGAASTALLLGPVRPGRHGAPVNFEQLDPSGNVAATVSMSDYYATIAGWLGLPPSEVLTAPGSTLTSLGL
jgi:uncharacterized protein (DUF1501 family)